MNARIVSVYGNMVVAQGEGRIVQNSVGYCHRQDGARLLCEVIRIRGRQADLQVFEETRGLRVGDEVSFGHEMLSATLGPGLLGQIYDGLQKPLPRFAEQVGYFLQPGVSIAALDSKRIWEWTPEVEPGAGVAAGDTLGTVPEGIFRHPIMVPFAWQGMFRVESVAAAGAYTIEDDIAVLADSDGSRHPVRMQQKWPVKRPLCVARQRLMPSEPLVTRIRIIDSIFPIVRGGTYCIPGPFGAGKTVLQQITSRHAEIDIVILTACGERAGEVVETIREFPKLKDPRTGQSLMNRTIIVCNTSAMPVAARDASVYTGVTLAEYYRQAGFDVLFLADSTSRWAQAMREISGRLEEIPGEEAFPAYLESRIANFYERAGVIRLRDGRTPSVTIGGTVSPAGGNFDEPVTQATLKVVGAFHGLSRERSDARRYPAIDLLESWSRYAGIIAPAKVERVRALVRRGDEVRQMMTVVGEEGTSVEDFTVMLKSDFFDSAYLQQNAFDEIDGATPRSRQRFVFDKVLEVLNLDFAFRDKDEARRVMLQIGNLFRDLNYAPWDESVVDGGAQSFAEESGGSSGSAPKQQTPGDPQDETAAKAPAAQGSGGKSGERGSFAAILAEIDAFIRQWAEQTAGGEAAEPGPARPDERGEAAGRGRFPESAKGVHAKGRPRSRRTLAGEMPDTENEHPPEEDEG